jgi:hypothetical protein
MGVICAVRHPSDFTALLACRLQMQITVVAANMREESLQLRLISF